ncbi:MAG: hypothetical protein HC780_02760 [Leptolyngbyaceae cyanobacterium CSU_1_3]|nr:hypothetical protein [Leptolyngbyaceae cyanobacterium CSU_1_3]
MLIVFAPSTTLDFQRRLEIESARADLHERTISLADELAARLAFVLGLDALSNRQMAIARSQFEQSLTFWQSSHQLKQQGCLLYYLGFWWRKQASLDRSYYDQHCATAQTYFQQCIDAFRRAECPHLVAKFINAWGEVLERRNQWDELTRVARKAIQLHFQYRDPIRLAFAYGLLAEAALAKAEWPEAKQIAERAIQVLKNAQETNHLQNNFDQSGLDQNNPEQTTDSLLDWEEQTNYGWYLLLLSTAQVELEQTKAAIHSLENAVKIGHQLTAHLYIKILQKLHEIYRQQGDYRKAFHTKRKLYSVQQQYGFRAFVGAGYLQPCRSEEGADGSRSRGLAFVNRVAPEIQVSRRSQDVETLVQKISTHHHNLIVIYGPSGVGKSSLIHAGLIPALEKKSKVRGQRFLPPIVMQKYGSGRWEKDLGLLLSENLHPVREVSTLLDSAESILNYLEENRKFNLISVLIFDQFEEFFFVCKSPSERQKFYQFLRNALEIPAVKVIFSIRQDYLYYLFECDRSVNLSAISSDFLTQNTLYYLGNFSKKDAKAVIEALTQRTEFPLEDNLVDQLVQDLAHELGEIRPIELQIVGSQLEEEQITTLQQYKKQKNLSAEERIKTLIESWLDQVIKDCGFANRDVAWKVLYLLTHKENTRTIRTRSELMSASSAAPSSIRFEQIQFILRVLIYSGLVSRLREDSKVYYQLIHDYLVAYIREEYNRRFEDLGQKINQLRNRLLQGDLFDKLDAVIKLGELNNPQAIKPLKSLLEKEHTIHEVSLRWQIFKTLSEIKDEDEEGARLLLEKGLSDPEPIIQAHAANLLGQLKYQPATANLLTKCHAGHRCVRVQARRAILQMGNNAPELLSEDSHPLLAYILIKGLADTSVDADRSRTKQLRDLRLDAVSGVVEGGVIQGDYDVLIKVIAENMEALNELLISKIQLLGWVKSTRTFIVVNEPLQYYWCRQLSSKPQEKFVVYVLIKAPALSSDRLVACLMDVPEVSEAATVYGQYDVIAKIEASSLERRDEVLSKKIIRIPSVTATHSYPVVASPSNFYWNNSRRFKVPREWLIGDPNSELK